MEKFPECKRTFFRIPERSKLSGTLEVSRERERLCEKFQKFLEVSRILQKFLETRELVLISNIFLPLNEVYFFDQYFTTNFEGMLQKILVYNRHSSSCKFFLVIIDFFMFCPFLNYLREREDIFTNLLLVIKFISQLSDYRCTNVYLTFIFFGR